MKAGARSKTPIGASKVASTKATDGRFERSRSSRAKIVAAMLSLVADGDVQPSAA